MKPHTNKTDSSQIEGVQVLKLVNLNLIVNLTLRMQRVKVDVEVPKAPCFVMSWLPLHCPKPTKINYSVLQKNNY